MKGKRLYHSVAEQIKKLILNGTYPPGSRLPGERELAEQLEVSRVTVREAEIALQAMGYIDIKTGSGVYVLDPANVETQGLPITSAFELTEARLAFESEAAALAARHINDETLEQLQVLLDEMSSGDPQHDEAALEADRQFHLTIARASGNSVVLHVIETLWKIRNDMPKISKIHKSICAVEDADERHLEHVRVLDALRERDPLAARQAMRQHFTSLLQSMIDVTEERALNRLRKKTTETRQRYLS